MAKKLKPDYIEEAQDRDLLNEDADVIGDMYTRDELRELIQKDKKISGEYFNPIRLAIDLDEYKENNTITILKGFMVQQGISESHFYRLCDQNDHLNHAKEMCLMKKEVNLEKGSLSGRINTTMAIFSLKQLGWSDDPEKSSAHRDTEEPQTLAEFMRQTYGESEGNHIE